MENVKTNFYGEPIFTEIDLSRFQTDDDGYILCPSGIIPKSVFSLLAVNSMTAAGFAVAMLPLALNVFLVLFASLEKIFNLVMPVDLKKADLLTATVFSIKAAFFIVFVLFHLAVNSMLVVHSMTIQAFQMVAV